MLELELDFLVSYEQLSDKKSDQCNKSGCIINCIFWMIILFLVSILSVKETCWVGHYLGGL